MLALTKSWVDLQPVTYKCFGREQVTDAVVEAGMFLPFPSGRHAAMVTQRPRRLGRGGVLCCCFSLCSPPSSPRVLLSVSLLRRPRPLT